MSSSIPRVGFRRGVREAVGLTTTISMGAMPCSSMARRCAELERMARIPPAIFGCRVLTPPVEHLGGSR